MKKGDKVWVQCEVVRAESEVEGDIHLLAVDSDGSTRTGVWVSPDACHPAPPDHSAYIGKTLADVPDGTVAVTSTPYCNTAQTRIRVGSNAHSCDPTDLTPMSKQEESHGNASDHIILHIIKLGEPKPVTLAEAVYTVPFHVDGSTGQITIEGDQWKKIQAKAREERQQQHSA